VRKSVRNTPTKRKGLRERVRHEKRNRIAKFGMLGSGKKKEGNSKSRKKQKEKQKRKRKLGKRNNTHSWRTAKSTEGGVEDPARREPVNANEEGGKFLDERGKTGKTKGSEKSPTNDQLGNPEKHNKALKKENKLFKKDTMKLYRVVSQPICVGGKKILRTRPKKRGRKKGF